MFRNAGNILLIFFACLLMQGSKINDNKEVRILFTGDILLSRNVRTEIQSKKTSPWHELQSLFKGYDLVVGNLEGAVGNSDNIPPSVSKSPVFDIKKKHISLLKDAGFNVITIENNHGFDLGNNGRNATIQSLRDINITPVFLDNSPQFFTVKNIVVAIVAINLVPDRNLNKNTLPSIEIKQKLRLAKSLSNMVIVSIHWGSELLDWPNTKQRTAASWLIKNGADLIIGSHPHVIQKPELIEGKPVYFSLGNHLFDQKYPETKTGLIADIRISDNKFQCCGILIHTKKNSFYPEIIEKNSKDYDFKPLPLNDNALKIKDFVIKPVSVNIQNKNMTILEAFNKEKLIWRSHPVSLISIKSARLDGENELLFALESHYSNIDKEIAIRPYVYDIDDYGMVAKWRGSALAWPMLDAVISPDDSNVLCALHRGDSFINPDTHTDNTRVAAYRWNGFGFTGIDDEEINGKCRELLEK
jgi:poly-gamma-glutamate synthesis protein (capsule biosynthesis protein)